MRIDWKNLKGGFAEFEKLAVEFVSEVETRNGCEWKQTKSTRDKNHDAILARENKDSSKPEFAVFVGYEYGVDIWWMEAKYSADSNEKKGMLSRYRLDATIVSAMLSRKISKIVFVTNLDIAPKTIIDIREALLRSNSCQEVRFYTKNHLENWILDKSPDFIESKFNYTSDMYTKIERPLFNVIEELSFYTLDSNYFQEPLNNIYTGIVYKVYFSVSVQNDSEAILDRCTNIEFLTDDVRKLQLKKGTNDFHFFARIPKDLHYESIQKTDVQGELKKILPPTIIYKMKCCASIDVHQLHIIPITSLKIINSTNVVFSLASQNRVVEELCTALLNHKNNAELTFSMISLFGRSGIGKSHVLQQFEARLLKKKYPIICNSYSFSGDMLTDIRLLQKIVFCLFFPYLFWEDLNQDYIQELRQLHPNIKSEFWDFVWLETEIEYFVSYSENPLLLASVLPEHVCINERIIILDDVQKMPAKCKQLLETMFIVLIQHKYPVFCIVTSQQKMDLEKYRIGKRQFLSSIELNLCVADICALFGNENMDFNDSLITTLFGSLIEVLYFKKYLSTLGKSIENVDDFKLAYLSFIHSELLKNEIVNKFTSVFRENKDAEALCSCIYYTASGIPQKLLCNVECTKKMLDLLMDAELIKRNDSDCYVYWHDYYREIFISHFQLTPYNGLQIPFKDTYDLKLQLALQNRDNIAIEHVLTQIQNLFDVQKYYSVYYILENVFLISSVKEWYKKHLS